jgi:hypothetical protein
MIRPIIAYGRQTKATNRKREESGGCRGMSTSKLRSELHAITELISTLWISQFPSANCEMRSGTARLC